MVSPSFDPTQSLQAQANSSRMQRLTNRWVANSSPNAKATPRSQVEFELLSRLTLEDEFPYPWHHAQPHQFATTETTAEALDEIVETDFDAALGWNEASIAQGAAQFFQHLDHLWEQESATQAATQAVTQTAQPTTSQAEPIAAAKPVARTITTLTATLRAQFGDRIPQAVLETLSQRAYALTEQAQNLSARTLDRLIYCVDGLLPGWSSDDWQVMARPYAFSMRNGAAPATPCISETKWEELSATDRAKLSLEIALAALAELDQDQPTREFCQDSPKI